MEDSFILGSVPDFDTSRPPIPTNAWRIREVKVSAVDNPSLLGGLINKFGDGFKTFSGRVIFFSRVRTKLLLDASSTSSSPTEESHPQMWSPSLDGINKLPCNSLDSHGVGCRGPNNLENIRRALSTFDDMGGSTTDSMSGSMTATICEQDEGYQETSDMWGDDDDGLGGYVVITSGDGVLRMRDQELDHF